MISKIKISNFITFKSFEYEQTSNLTVILGKNDSGKSGLLKLLYASSKALVEISRSHKEINLKAKLSEKLFNTFMPKRSGLGELVSKGEEGQLDVQITFEADELMDLHFSFSGSAEKGLGHCSNNFKVKATPENAIFIPAKEVLTAFRAIAFTRRNYDYLDFDDTYLDLVQSLEIPIQKIKLENGLQKINKELSELFEGEVVQNIDDSLNPFLYKKGNSLFSMPMTAEGIKKIGIVGTLLKNRELGKNTLLYIDEPETALHPEAQRKFAELLYHISELEGVQVFLSTHSYFIVNQFHNIAKRENVAINCIALEKREGVKFVEYAINNLIEGLPENGIVNEALEMYKEKVAIDLK